MADDLRLYNVTVGAYQTHMRLNDTDAARMGADAVPVIEQRPAPVSVAPELATPDARSKNRLVTSNKARGTDQGV